MRDIISGQPEAAHMHKGTIAALIGGWLQTRQGVNHGQLRLCVWAVVDRIVFRRVASRTIQFG